MSFNSKYTGGRIQHHPAPSLTETAGHEKLNPNYILRRAQDQDTIAFLNSNPGMFIDHGVLPRSVGEYQNLLLQGYQAAEKIPSHIRERFKSPKDLFKFLDNPENRALAEEYGMIKKTPPPQPQQAVSGGSGGAAQ